MYSCSCIIHNDFLPPDKLIKLSEMSFRSLTECKKIRLSLGGENHRENQCKVILKLLNEELLYFHREFYQKFTYARTLQKRKFEKENEATKSN